MQFESSPERLPVDECDNIDHLVSGMLVFFSLNA